MVKNVVQQMRADIFQVGRYLLSFLCLIWLRYYMLRQEPGKVIEKQTRPHARNVAFR